MINNNGKLVNLFKKYYVKWEPYYYREVQINIFFFILMLTFYRNLIRELKLNYFKSN